MKKVEKIFTWTKTNQEQNFVSIDLGKNCDVSKVVVQADMKQTDDLKVIIRYAQNGITSDWIPFVGESINKEYGMEIEVAIPTSASHVYVELQKADGGDALLDCTIEQIEIYEEKKMALTECQEYEEVAEDKGNIAFKKPVHVSVGKTLAQNITDGSYKTFWQGECYPTYIDIDLESNYYLDKMEVYMPDNQELYYSIYTSLNGRDFDMISEGKDIVTLLNGKEARILRIYIEYSSTSTVPIINLVRVLGKESKSVVIKRPEIQVPAFEGIKYQNAIKPQDTYDEVFGIISRRVGKEYHNWFELELAENPINGHEYDYYELTDKNGKIHVKGNNGVSLATGINYYLKYFCHVHISQVGDQLKMPKEIIPVHSVIFRETKAKVRYAYNYCTFSYSMAFYGRKEWRDELDWLALNSVNLVLDITGQEEVWRRFLSELGYSHEDIKDFIAGPAYYAWAYMANISGFGGPIHDSWFEERVELARENHYIMRKLGMQPVLQGYSGMLPNDICRYDSEVEIIEQGTWCGFLRPAMIKTTSDSFITYAQKFYRVQKEVYGNVSNYYATDPFHEGGNTGGMSAREISRIVLSAMLQTNLNAVWVIQSWQGNPTSELLAGLEEVPNGKNHALVLDLYAEKTPHYGEGASGSKAYGYRREFNSTQWVFCMLNNFGGRLGMHGHLDNLADNIPTVFNQCSYIAGIGMAPEASANNPVLYDFLFEAIWQENAEQSLPVIPLNHWLAQYAERRYGAQSATATKAWELLKETVYKAEWNNLGQGAPECVVNARPALEIQAASAWGNAIVSYNTELLKQAKELLLADYERFKDSAGYQYDIATIQQQVLSNEAFQCQRKMSHAFETHQTEEFDRYAQQFLQIIDEMEKVTCSNEYYRLDRWIRQAETLAENSDDFSRKLYVWNAKMLITTWGSYDQSEKGRLHDYSNRQWSCLIKSFYKPRWERWIEERKRELIGEKFEEFINWFEWEWNWVRWNSK